MIIFSGFRLCWLLTVSVCHLATTTNKMQTQTSRSHNSSSVSQEVEDIFRNGGERTKGKSQALLENQSR
ncbi:CLUMA_CG009327, isoform A [Clunio marinus]|uniref:CLUMA_CG009327, isoform A n=1 Tax=Clunio marinus TaxID=568069 RepID=A0A1J1IBR5_9DIPT|nr:CLUMA_CG009327, isoform A [Clunio marinus]